MERDLRLFIAVPIAIKLRRKFANIIERLKTCGADVKWVSEENLHITLKFLGDTTKNKVKQVEQGIKEALEGFEATRIKFQGIGAFPSLKKPRVFWIGVSAGGENLAGMAKALEIALEPLGFPPEDKEFRSHLTIGRVRSNKGIAPLMEQIERLKDFNGGSLKVSEVLLINSDLQKSGPIYTTLSKFPLIDVNDISELDDA